ncbi:hypothetical protein [Microvirga aerophila]|uniref:Uncharacterized protein n=1 Tax=Microvirga aerophila TaxID=670291 RepID=A0A512C2N8_9HYPH|nr:hypothetical protein [Microvirga aerophila]GEO18461.1 hypothetical protein MAE02_61570 [Microvirga aerophila]
MMLRPEHAPALELVFQAVNATVGPCRFEGTTFRSVALAIPLVRRAAEVLVGGSLLRPRLYRDSTGHLHGRLTKHAFWMLSTEAMHVWRFFVVERGLTVRRHWDWVYWDTGHGLPPRIDHLTDVRLPIDPFPVAGWRLPKEARDQRGCPIVPPPPTCEE